ncbi:hypothetical protein [Actinacidiphila alni]|uniref:hypothetical protein n=1 Tax=Actinacidiphila alni TaxID=380248 RepID=UPI003455ADD0
MTERVTIQDVAPHLPSVARLRDVCRALAALEIVRHPAMAGGGEGTGGRAYDFLCGWRTGADVAVRRTGGGDGYAVAFTCYGALLLGFDHESPMSPYASAPPRVWPGVLDAVPRDFAPYVAEPPAFLAGPVPLVTACAWRAAEDDRWRTGEDIVFPAADSGSPTDDRDTGPDGAGRLFRPLTDPAPAQSYARGTGMPAGAVREVYALRPLDRTAVAELNPAADFATVAAELERIGYPVAR